MKRQIGKQEESFGRVTCRAAFRTLCWIFGFRSSRDTRTTFTNMGLQHTVVCILAHAFVLCLD